MATDKNKINGQMPDEEPLSSMSEQEAPSPFELDEIIPVSDEGTGEDAAAEAEALLKGMKVGDAASSVLFDSFLDENEPMFEPKPEPPQRKRRRGKKNRPFPSEEEGIISYNDLAMMEDVSEEEFVRARIEEDRLERETEKAFAAAVVVEKGQSEKRKNGNGTEPKTNAQSEKSKESESNKSVQTQERRKTGELDISTPVDNISMPYLTKLVIVLTVISAIIAGMLAIVNDLTKDTIAENDRKARESAVLAVFPEGDNCREYIVADGSTVYFAAEGDSLVGYCVSVSPAGYSGDIDMMVGISPEGEVTGIQIVNLSETPGVGTKVRGEGFLSQFVGKAVGETLTVGENVDGIGGATFSSKAVTAGVNEALAVDFDLTEAAASLGLTMASVQVPETDVPVLGTPETAAPETELPETVAPETVAPETIAPETIAPETAVPETELPETAAAEIDAPPAIVIDPEPQPWVPETVSPETMAPDPDPETNAPETDEPETGEPETGTPETGTPETGEPETGEPETGEPETGVPETGVPETGEPETGEPETGEPETGVPETGVPETDAPETSESETEAETKKRPGRLPKGGK